MKLNEVKKSFDDAAAQIMAAQEQPLTTSAIEAEADHARE